MKCIDRRVIVCGYGDHGRRVAVMLGDKLVAICEPDPRLHSQIAKNHNHTLVFNCIQEVDSRMCDCVFELGTIASRRDVHSWSNDHGVPAVLEKPLALCEEDLERYRYGKYTVNFRELYHKTITSAMEILQKMHGSVRNVTFIRANTVALDKWHDATIRSAVCGGSILDKGIHDIATLVFHLVPDKVFSIEKPSVNSATIGVSAGQLRMSCNRADSLSRPTPLASDISFVVSSRRSQFHVRMVSSWIGMDPAELRAYGKLFADGAVWRAKVKSGSFPFQLHPWHCKIAIVEFDSAAGVGSIFISTMHRSHLAPFVSLRIKHDRSNIYERRMGIKCNQSWCYEQVIGQAIVSNDAHVRKILRVHEICFRLNEMLLGSNISHRVAVPDHIMLQG